jgi:hypothetical protein
MGFINEDDNLSSLGIAIRAFDTRGLPVPINETYFSFSCQKNSVDLERENDGTVTRTNTLTVRMSCFSPLKNSAFSAHNLTEKIVDAISQGFSDDITGFSIGETKYDDDVKSYKITADLHFQYSS